MKKTYKDLVSENDPFHLIHGRAGPIGYTGANLQNSHSDWYIYWRHVTKTSLEGTTSPGHKQALRTVFLLNPKKSGR